MIFATMPIIVLFGVLFLFIPIIEKDNSKRGVMIQSIFTNPLIIGDFLGLLLLILNIKLPIFIVNTIKDISKMATPLSLTLLRAGFDLVQ